MELLTTRYANHINGVLGCFDRLIFRGTLPSICFGDGLATYLRKKEILLKDYTKFVDPLREELRLNAENLASKNDIEIEFIRSTNARKEDIAKKNYDPNKFGLVAILSAMEACNSFRAWHDKNTHKNTMKAVSGKCLHYYFYFNDPDMDGRRSALVMCEYPHGVRSNCKYILMVIMYWPVS